MLSQDTFIVGPPDPVTDSRALPAVSAQDEASFVHGVDLGGAHPDNEGVEAVLDEDIAGPEPDPHAGEELPDEDALDSMLADVDPDAVDTIGFDQIDLADVERDILDARPAGGQ